MCKDTRCKQCIHYTKFSTIGTMQLVCGNKGRTFTNEDMAGEVVTDYNKR